MLTSQLLVLGVCSRDAFT
ncbi:DUF645 family protein [Vibrio cholerae]|nr:DUF645 family protein [Vibrio cholerae]MCD9212845.1 DUF645 family protein [Vibrio cholerae]MDV2308449.1 DUF645 family protein [Vibrio cholerae]